MAVYLGGMRFQLPALHDQAGRHPAFAQAVQSLDRGQPALVRVHAPELEEPGGIPNGGANGVTRLDADRLKQLRRDTVGNHLRVHAVGPHLGLYVAGHCGELRHVSQPIPVDAVEGHVVVGVPEQDGRVANAQEMQRVAEPGKGVGGVPFLGNDRHAPPGAEGRLDNGLRDKGWHRILVVMNLRDLVGIGAFRMGGADPLAPAMEMQPAVLARFRAGQARIADEDQVRVEAVLGQRSGELGDAHAQSAGLRVGLVWSFEGQEDELGGCQE